MPELLHLPEEMVEMIIEQTSAGDIGSLASCCSRLHRLSQKRLTFHKKKRAEAMEIHLGGAAPYASVIHPLKHLQDIFENDDIRYYTRVINIRDLGPVDPNGNVVVDEKRLEEEKNFIASMKSQYDRQISALVAEVYDALLPYANKIDRREWTDKVISGEREAVAILLLALCPYLNTLEIEETSLDWFHDEKTTEERESMPDEHGNEAPWVNLFRSLTATASEPGTNRLKIFSKLSKFYLTGEESQDYFRDNLGPVTPFIALPAMRRIICHNVAGYNVPWPYSVGTSNVTDLTLSGFVDTVSLRNFISGLRSLKKFHYQIINPEWENGNDYRDRMKWGPHLSIEDVANIDPDDYSDTDEDCSVDDPGQVVDASLPRWEPRAITECLLQYAYNSLVSLVLDAFSFLGVSDLSDGEPFIPSLRSFQVLTYVRLDTMMLFERVERPETILVIDENSNRRMFQEAIKARKLVDFFPSSIECIGISCEYVGKSLSRRDVEAMFAGLPEQKDRLPKLSNIQFSWMNAWKAPASTRNLYAEKGGYRELIKRCDDCEIELGTNMGDLQPSLSDDSSDSGA